MGLMRLTARRHDKLMRLVLHKTNQTGEIRDVRPSEVKIKDN